MTRFDLTEIQARAILDLRLQRLTQLEAGKIQAEYDELQARIAELRAILGDESPRLRADPLRAARDPGQLRGRAPHRDRPRRGRHRPRGPDRRGGDGHLHLQRRLRQAPAGLHLPGAGARRQGAARGAAQGRGLHRAPLHRLDAPLPALLHQQGQGLPPEGPRAAPGLARLARAPHRQRARPPAGRGRPRRLRHARLRRGQVPGPGHPRRHGQEDRDAQLRHRAARARPDRDQPHRGRRAGRRAADRRRRRPPGGLGARPGGPLRREPGPPDEPRHPRRARHEPRQGRPRAGALRRARRRGAARGDRQRLRQADADGGLPAQGPPHQGRPHHQGHRPQGRAGHGPPGARGPGAAADLAARPGDPDQGRRQSARPAAPPRASA